MAARAMAEEDTVRKRRRWPWILAGALRGRGDSRAPMFIMLACFVGARQIYLYLVTHFVANTPLLVGLGYPVGWTLCFIVEVTYFLLKYIRTSGKKAAAA